VTPAPLLGRMTSTMRWLILLPAGPGALLGGWIGSMLGVGTVDSFSLGSIALAVGGALIILFLYRKFSSKPA
jgi:uncharacterized membrane protein YeaQ/YmgE (transglycosylase-associated protein family)